MGVQDIMTFLGHFFQFPNFWLIELVADLKISDKPEALEHLADVETKGNRSFGSSN